MKKRSLLLIAVIVLSIFTRINAINVADSVYIDIGIVAFWGPDTVYVGDTATYGAIIKNFGTRTEINVPISAYVIGTSYISTQVISLAPGCSLEMLFGPYIFPEPRTYVLVCTIGINDSNPTNNCRRKTIVVLPLGIEQEKSVSTYQTITLFPNPFTSNLQISSELNRDLEVEVYNTNGSLVNRLLGGSKILWDGKDSKNNLLPAGIYFLKISENDYHKKYRVLLLR